jgi:signal transduction histidine kinase
MIGTVRDPRRSPVVTVLPYALLAILAAVTVVAKHQEPDALLVDLALCALTAAWICWMITLHPAWLDRPRVVTVFFTVLVVLTAVLVVRDPWFGCFTPAGYVYAFRLLPWPWQQAGVAAVAVEAGTAQVYAVDKTTPSGIAILLAVVVVNVVPMCGFAWFNRRLGETLAENARLQERLVAQAREAGMHDERQRMAREIHDTLAQGLTGIISQLRATEQAGEDPAEWRRHVTAATGLARESLSEARRSVRALRPEPLRAARLGEALTDVAERWSGLHGIPATVTTTGTARPMPPEAEAALLRAAQEALANVARHAKASRVGVTLSYLEHEVALDVRDDGRGFAPGRTCPRADGGFGLVAMRQRIEGLSGTVQVESEPGGGTGISARVPVETS